MFDLPLQVGPGHIPREQAIHRYKVGPEFILLGPEVTASGLGA